MLTGPYLELVDIHKSFGDAHVLKGVNLSISKGEFVTLLGPSGCGKTTTLNITAGLLTADSGEIRIGGKEMSNTPPHKRGLGMVFQNYALFPHMPVFDNIAFGLKFLRTSKDEIPSKVSRVMDLVNLPIDTYQARYPHQLSGGEQQRVSLARALVIEPSVLLLDEPLSNLDAKLRDSMRAEIRRIQKEVRITTVYVTHDQEEALAMSDRVAVFQSGTIAQIASPLEIYRRPGSVFVADFIGHSNFIRGRVQEVSNATCTVVTDGGLAIVVPKTDFMTKNKSLVLAVRAEKIALLDKRDSRENIFEGTVESSLYMGSTSRVTVAVGDLRLFIHVAGEEVRTGKIHETGETVYVELNPRDIMVLHGETES